MADNNRAPFSLRRWFVIHFAIDIAFAMPMMIAPVYVLELFGWTEIDPLTTRLVAAALFGIGIESLLGRDSCDETYRAMLNLKIIWSTAAIIGLVLSIIQGAPAAAWLFVAIFAAFSCAWWYYRLKLRSI